jgi:hypothetical protein
MKWHEASHSFIWNTLTFKQIVTLAEIYIYHLLVAISETTKLFLPSSVPAIESDFTTVGAKIQRVNFNTNGGCTK